MPVVDHPVHESTKRIDNRPSCWNARKPTSPGYWAQDGWEIRKVFISLQYGGFDLEIQQPKLVWVEHRMTTECQSDFPGCAGCKDFNQKGTT